MARAARLELDGVAALIVTSIDVGRAVYVWVGAADVPPSCGDVVAAAPSPVSGGAAATSHLLDGAASAADADEADTLAALLSTKTGKLVLLSLGSVCADLPPLAVAALRKAIVEHVKGGG